MKADKFADFLRKSMDSDKLCYLYTLYDRKADYCHPLTCTPSEPGRFYAECRRAAMNGLVKYPEDLDLVFVGVFNDGTAEIKALDKPQVIGSLELPADFQRKEKEDVQISDQQTGA